MEINFFTELYLKILIIFYLIYYCILFDICIYRLRIFDAHYKTHVINTNIHLLQYSCLMIESYERLFECHCECYVTILG